jgi:hypothetical protein
MGRRTNLDAVDSEREQALRWHAGLKSRARFGGM